MPAYYTKTFDLNKLEGVHLFSVWLRSRIDPEHLRFSWKILLSGYLPEYLYESQRLDTRIPFNELQRQSLINERAQGVAIKRPIFQDLSAQHLNLMAVTQRGNDDNKTVSSGSA